jgi:phenylacetate-coenzyme A ligase PaaK-like adenylate-forming protein
MDFSTSFKVQLTNLSAHQFQDACLDLFDYQYSQNEVYKSYCEAIRVKKSNIKTIEQIPFLPISFFKTHQVIVKNKIPKIIFESSGTTGSNTSKHYVSDPDFYLEVATHIFCKEFGRLEDFHFFALLPSYKERGNSSLVYMMNHFMKHQTAQYYLYNHQELYNDIKTKIAQKQKIVVWGVTFGLLDFFETYSIDLQDNIIIETGGMKGRKQEMVREEVHELLSKASRLKNIGSEYGMTELLSQGYAKTNGIFSTPTWMRVLLRDSTDPFSVNSSIKRGGINIIDLANIDSCAFIETSDLGERLPNNQFKVLGRFDNSDIRGCNLMVV